MEQLILRQEDVYQCLVRAFENYKKSPKDRITVFYIRTRDQQLDKDYETFCGNHYQLVNMTTKEHRDLLDYFVTDTYNECQELYIDYKSRLLGDLEKLAPSQGAADTKPEPGSGNAVNSKPEVQLPRIELPKFSGNYDEWQSFFDMFTSLIHKNTSLKEVQKLHYLKSSLSGEPELLLRNLAVTDANYEEAWKKLTQRYTNKRYNCNEIMKRLFSQKAITTESATSTKQLLDNTSACLKSLQNLDISIDSWDPVINYLVVSKLDTESRKLWELYVSQNVPTDALPTWEKLITFMETRFRTLEMLDGPKSGSKGTQSNNTKQITKHKSFHSTVNNNEKKLSNNTCIMCSGGHPLYQCKQYENLSPEKRTEYVQSNKLCFNCLSSTHSVRGCHLSTSCRRCGRRHHTTLHFEREHHQLAASPENSGTENQPPGQKQPQSVSQQTNNSESRVVAHFAKESNQGNQSRVLLATALVNIVSSNGYHQLARALIDQGSEASFVTEATAQSLGLQRTSINGFVSGVGEGQTRTKSMVTFNIESLHNPEFSISVHAFVLKKLTSFLPSQQTSILDWPAIENLSLADPKYGSPSKIDVILGVDVLSEILKEGFIKHPSLGGPVAQNTQLGWILSGKVKTESLLEDSPFVSLHIEVKEDELLKQFWEIEREPDNMERKVTEREKRCEEIYNETTIRDDSGRYMVRLPFKSANPECVNGNSKEIALKRLALLEKKFLRNPSLREEYSKAIKDYLIQDHMALIVDKEQIAAANVVYLPHHAVVREDKDTTKLRVVFDASCKGKNNVSLNDELLVGPKIQQDLRHILMRWRRHSICIVADLKQMYRQVIVQDQDTDFQRILWRSDPYEPIQHYRMKRLTFGTASAPYLAVKSLQTLAVDESSMYPVASQITLEDYYMDDLLSGCDTYDEAIEIYEQETSLMRAGGFELQKWCSNSERLLKHIKTENLRSDGTVVFKSNEINKVLGISWNKNTDNFEYNLQLPVMSETPTKRSVLSDIAKLYDPIGWIAPLIFTGKVFIQKLWKSNLDWDENLTPELLREWRKFIEDLVNVPSIVIPRWLQTKRDVHVELHAFADASQAGYAAAVYLKTRDKEGKVSVNLVTSKTKVAPVQKVLSIPRLELCAALLAAKLIHEVSYVMKVPRENVYVWSDSTVVLAWIAGEPHRWVTFVSNRVSEILTMVDRDQWRHVSTIHNPADCASRGISSAELVNHELWWHGPEWLKDDYESQGCQEFETAEEERPVKVLTTVVQPKENFIWIRFSTLPRLLRVLSYCKRILNLKLPKEQRVTLSKTVTADEMSDVMQHCIRKTQTLYFQEEIKHLKAHNCVPKKSRLHTLNPIFDENGVLRVGGRINEAQVEYDTRHPIILPSESHFTRLIVSDAHIKTLHGGPQLMLNFLRTKYWIIRARDLVKKHYRSCTKCVRYSRQDNNQLMGQLPKDRLKPTRAFKISGVDFTGHINIRFSPGRGAKSYKGYICVFICMISKAIHLEAVTDMTAQGFIAAFRRFVSRRGHCQTLYSDNGTNFVGADRELREMFCRFKSQLPVEIGNLLANEGTTWNFIPPHAPNFGGLWEAGVRSTKTHLKRVIGDSTLTYEELSTVLTQIEACLNSRPLSYLSDNPDDPLPLTPGHFLIGSALGIFILTFVTLTDCDVVTDTSEKPLSDKAFQRDSLYEVNEIPKSEYQRDSSYLSNKVNEIPEPESLPVLHGNDTKCRISEYLCLNKKCVPINRFCDGNNDCGDASDEPRHCTRCNKTYYGDIGRTYELELHRPREDLVPYVCLLTITAAGGIHGDLVQVLFDSFTLGRFTSFTDDGCPDGYLQIQEASRPQVGGSWCGTSWGPSIYYSETKSITLIIRLLHLSKEQNNYNFDFRMAYKVLRKEHATVRFGGTPPSERPFFKLRPPMFPVNTSRGEDTNVAKTKTEYYLGDLISGTYCSRIFSDCDRKNCRLQSPNYPGVYPRNLTCYYAVRQHEVPQGKHALIVVKQPNGQLVSIRSQKALYAAAQQERGNNGRELKFWQQCDEVQDYVTVYDGYTTRDPVILRFCGGGVSVPEAISSGPELLVEFTTSPFGTFLQPATSQSLHGFQLEVEVRFVDQQSPTYAKNKRACEFWIRGTGRGVLEHPQHSLPPNTTCLYHMQGIDTSGPSGRNIIYRRPSFSAPRFRVWFSVLKFYVTNALNPNLPEDEYCGSHLNIWDGPMRISPGCSDIFCDKDRSVQMSRATSAQTVIVGRPPTNATLVARFCRERAPRTCEHALLRRSRACARTESFLSKGDSLTLELKLTQGTALKPVFFTALYEFVDLHQDGETWGRGPCSRRFVSRSFPEAPPDPPVTFSSPRDVFLYGRGGARNISCTYRFEANPGEVVRLRVWGIRSGGRLCRSVHSAHSPWFRCAGDPTAAVRIFDKPWKDIGPGVPRDCLCSDTGDYEFTSTGTVAELKFDVVNMSSTEDFRSFGFEASVEFVRLESECESSHKVYGASGDLRLASQAPMSEVEKCERRPWLIDPSPGRYLYLQIRGSIIKEPVLDNFTLLNNITVAPDLRHLCRTPNRIAIYAGGLSPIFVCPDPPDEQYEDIIEVFSDGWSKEVDPLARHVLAPPPAPDHFDLDWPRSLSVELIALEPASYFVTWLELSRRHSSTRGGVYAMSGECAYRCESLDACIEPALWCDGISQCPHGEDERLSQCSALLRVPAQYAAALVAFSALAGFAMLAVMRSCRRRRSALQQRLKSLSSDTAIFDEKEVIC